MSDPTQSSRTPKTREPSPDHPDQGRPRKILPIHDFLRARDTAREQGQRLVQCHGCFDIVHPGHIRHLRHAKAQGDLLVVSITGDAQIAKGTGRPLIPEELRAENLAELDCVDYVLIDEHATARDLLERTRPDIYIKGREYERNQDPRFAAERETVERHGGRVVFSSGDVVFSSTALIGALQDAVDPSNRRLEQLARSPELAAQSLGSTIGAFRNKTVLVAGEVIRDTYVFCDRPEIAGESPMMTLRPVERRAYWGGAAIAARHAAALGARPILVTALPEGEQAERVTAELAAEGVEVRAVQSDAPIPEKQRFLVGTAKVMKLDEITPVELDARQREALISTAREAAQERNPDAALVMDFGLGLLTPAVMSSLTRTLRPLADVLAGDVSGRRGRLLDMREMDLVTPSEDELRSAAGEYDEGLSAVVWRVLSETGAKRAIVTMGADGLIGFETRSGAEHAKDRADRAWLSRLRGEHVPALVPHAVDALGCGDALLTTASLTLAAGGGLLESAFLGAAAAAIEARRLGNIPVDAASLRREVNRVHAAHLALTHAGSIPASIETTGAATDQPRLAS